MYRRHPTTVRFLTLLGIAALLALLVAVCADPEGADAQSPAFWEELARCESGLGAGDPNLLQFTADTWAKVAPTRPGPDGRPVTVSADEATLAEAIGAAQRWVAMLAAEGLSPASTAGWPTCWRIAEARLGTPAPDEQVDAEPAPRPAPPATPSRRPIALTG